MSQRVRPWYWPKGGQPERTEAFTWIEDGVIAASWWPDPEVIDIYTAEGVKAIVNCCEFDNRKVIHCVAGCGRTGQFIIAWCAKAGFIPKGTKPIDWIRKIRKCCLETKQQEASAERFCKKYRT